jgi:hypothetical protein
MLTAQETGVLVAHCINNWNKQQSAFVGLDELVSAVGVGNVDLHAILSLALAVHENLEDTSAFDALVA